MARRGKLEIIRDVMEIIRDNHSIRPTPLLRKSGISSSRFRLYYDELLDNGFVQETLVDKKGNKKITLTEKGFRFLEKYKTIAEFIDEFDL